jgi:phosphomannomutase
MKLSIFKAYDIRGVYPGEIDEEAAYLVGRSFVQFLDAKKVAVGLDMRESGKSLYKSLAKGITDQGASVVNIGMVSTPVLSFAVAQYKYDGGIMISASHNPAQYNAFKLVRYPAEQLSSETGIEAIRALVEKNKFQDAEKGKIKKKSVLPDYVQHILAFANGIKGLKVVFDYGNGVGSLATVPLMRQLDIDTIHMFQEPDGSFPNHPANPHELENLHPLQKKVKAEKADMGVFYDGDADRSVLIDEKGDIVPPDLLLGLLAVDELKRRPGQKVYYDLRFSRSVKEAIEAAKGIPVMMRVGNPFYKSALIKDGGILAGEFSGHIMYSDNFCIDDGLFAAIKTMDLLCRKKEPLSELIKPFRKYFQSEEINLTVKEGKSVLSSLKKQYKDGTVSELDGVLVQYPDWWFSIRMSNTEPLVRLRLEADSQKLLDEKRKELMGLISQIH